MKTRLIAILMLLVMIPVQAQVPLEQLTPENAPQVGRVGVKLKPQPGRCSNE